MLNFQHADLTRLYTYWLARRHGAGLPLRDDIDPVDLGWMLDRVSLFDCHPGSNSSGEPAPMRFRCRVAGTWFSRRFDFEANGSWLEDWPDAAMRDAVITLYRKVHGDGQARRMVRHFEAEGMTLTYEGAALPLGSVGQAGVAMILVGAAPISNPDLDGLTLFHAAGPYRSWCS